jgi:hypothetical protein
LKNAIGAANAIAWLAGLQYDAPTLSPGVRFCEIQLQVPQ